MGKKDAITKKYVKRREVFADAFNQYVYRGKQRVRPERLRELDTTEIALPYGEDGVIVPEQRYRDALNLLTAMTDGETAFCILGIEAHSDIHYAIPVKNGLYDFLQLAKQITEAAKSHRAAAKALHESTSVVPETQESETAGSTGSSGGDVAVKPTSGEFLGGFWKTDRLIPMVTLVIYFGAEEWDAPLTLREMYVCEDEELLAYAADYKVNLLAPGNLTDEEIELFQSDLREVMQYIKYSKDKKKITDLLEQNEHYKHMDRETAEVINVITNSKLKFEEEEEEADMCLALDEIREDCRAEGRAEGEARGQNIKLITLLCRKLAKGKSPEAIAEDLEEELGEIERIYKVAVKYAPDYDVEKIYAELSA